MWRRKKAVIELTRLELVNQLDVLLNKEGGKQHIAIGHRLSRLAQLTLHSDSTDEEEKLRKTIMLYTKACFHFDKGNDRKDSDRCTDLVFKLSSGYVDTASLVSSMEPRTHLYETNSQAAKVNERMDLILYPGDKNLEANLSFARRALYKSVRFAGDYGFRYAAAISASPFAYLGMQSLLRGELVNTTYRVVDFVTCSLLGVLGTEMMKKGLKDLKREDGFRTYELPSRFKTPAEHDLDDDESDIDTSEDWREDNDDGNGMM